MNSKTRVLKAFRKQSGNPDRIPVQFDLCRQLTDAFGRKLGIEPDYALSYYEDLTYRISANDIRTRMGSDVVVVGGTTARGYVPEPVQGDITKNEFGMHMKPGSLYVEVVKCPLEDASTVSDIENYRFPDAWASGRFNKAKRDIDRFGKDYFVIGDVELSLFELAWHLTGLEKYMVGMMCDEPWLELLNDRVEEWSTGLALQLVKAGVDAIWLGEDLGSQTSTLISPEDWRVKFKPRHKRMIEKVRQVNPDIIVIMHSDGAVAPLLDDFIEIGVDVYNPVQPNVPGSDPQELKDRYGDRICFFGGIDQQELLPSGDISRIQTEIKERIGILGKDRGYLLAPAHILQADVSMESIEAMIQVVREFGKYYLFILFLLLPFFPGCNHKIPFPDAKQFTNPDPVYRAYAGREFDLRTLDIKSATDMIHDSKEKGYGGVFIVSNNANSGDLDSAYVMQGKPHMRLGNEGMVYLSEEFLGVYKAAVEEAKKMGMQVILYDDYAFPTGTVAGQFYQKFPQLMASRLDKVNVNKKGKGTMEINFPEGTILGAVLMNQGDKGEIQEFNKYIGRMSYILQGGGHVSDVAVLYPIATAMAYNVFDEGWEYAYLGGKMPKEFDYMSVGEYLFRMLRMDYT